MGVAENGEAVGSELDGFVGRGNDAGGCLPRQPVDEIEVDAIDSGLAQRFDHVLRDVVGLHAVDRRLDRRVEILHAKAGAIDAARGERASHVGRQRARVDLDCDFGVADDVELPPQMFA